MSTEQARGEKSFRRQKSSPLDCVKHPFSEQREGCPTIALSFDQFQLGHVSLDHAVIDPPGETSSHGVFVFLHSSSKRLEFRKFAAFHLIKPGIEMLSSACAQHLGKLLNQIISQIDFRADQTECGHCLLLLNSEFFRATKKQ